ncbi:MAG: hypothetical protein NVS4B6_07090 [Mycobacterium sp.]
MRSPSWVYLAATCAALLLGSIGGMIPAMKQNITRNARSMATPDQAATFSILTCTTRPYCDGGKTALTVNRP